MLSPQPYQALPFFGKGSALGFDNRIQSLDLTVEVGNLFLDVCLLLDLGLPFLQPCFEGLEQR